ncbi:MAG: putative transposase [Tepidisphaeraceae bacterium]
MADAQAALGMACTDSVGRMAAALGGGPAPSTFQRCKDVSFGGVLCALPALAANGLFDYLAKLPGLPRGFYQQIHIILLLAYLALCRIRTAEQIRNQPPGELGKLLGLDRIPEVRTLRGWRPGRGPWPSTGCRPTRRRRACCTWMTPVPWCATFSVATPTSTPSPNSNDCWWRSTT